MTLMTLAVAALMLTRGHRRAALFTVGVSLATFLVTQAIKLLVGRARPEWQLEDALLSSKSFPSGHASSTTAFCAILIVLVVMLVRRGNVRRLLYVAAARSSSCWSASTGCCWAGTTPPT